MLCGLSRLNYSRVGVGGEYQRGQSSSVLFSKLLVDAISPSFESFYESRKSELNIKHSHPANSWAFVKRPLAAPQGHMVDGHAGFQPRATERAATRFSEPAFRRSAEAEPPQADGRVEEAPQQILWAVQSSLDTRPKR